MSVIHAWLAQHLGIEPAQWSHRILILPVNYRCPWVGLGSQACAPWPCVAWINIAKISWANDLLVHELGTWLCDLFAATASSQTSYWVWHPKLASGVGAVRGPHRPLPAPLPCCAVEGTHRMQHTRCLYALDVHAGHNLGMMHSGWGGDVYGGWVGEQTEHCRFRYTLPPCGYEGSIALHQHASCLHWSYNM
jgi:hypothetical protein